METNKISLLNAVDAIDLLFVSTSDKSANHGFEISKKFVNKMGNNFDKLNAHYLVGKSE